MEEWIAYIGNIGFPIVVTLYLLHRIESKLDAVVVAIEKLPQHFSVYDKQQIQKKATDQISVGFFFLLTADCAALCAADWM